MKIYKPTGEYFTTLYFGKREVDWNKVHQSLRSNCHCILAESDLESYVTVYGKEKDCIQAVVDDLKEYVREGLTSYIRIIKLNKHFKYRRNICTF